MNKAFLDSHISDFRDNIKTLKELSAPKDSCGNPPVLDAFSCGKIEGIDFDALRCKWHPWQPGTNVPCSVDALVLSRKEVIYFIEFKSGNTIERANLYRKIYDSVIMLFEHDKQDLKQMRQSATYIVVATKLQNKTIAVSRSLLFKARPWIDSRYKEQFNSWDLQKLEGVIVSKAFCMGPNIFDLFVKVERWI